MELFKALALLVATVLMFSAVTQTAHSILDLMKKAHELKKEKMAFASGNSVVPDDQTEKSATDVATDISGAIVDGIEGTSA